MGADPRRLSGPRTQQGVLNRAHDLPYWVLRGDYDESMALLDMIEKQLS
ncbi:hypothetical protein [Streptomyces globisporus]